MRTFSLIASLALLATAASAQTLTGLAVDTPTAKTGQPVGITAQFTVENNVFCGVRLAWGDGASEDIKMKDASQVPLKASHTYAKPGDYTISLTPAKVATNLACLGKAQTAMVKVAAAAPAPAAAAASAPASAAKAAAAKTCPDGWKEDAKSANKKTGAIMCTAKPGTALPEKKAACPGDLTYFENAKKGQFGCRA